MGFEVGHLLGASPRIQGLDRGIRRNTVSVLIDHFELLGARLLHLLERSSQGRFSSGPDEILRWRILAGSRILVINRRNTSNSFDAAHVEELAILEHGVAAESDFALIMTLLGLISLRVIGTWSRFEAQATVILASEFVVDEPMFRPPLLIRFHIRVLNKI